MPRLGLLLIGLGLLALLVSAFDWIDPGQLNGRSGASSARASAEGNEADASSEKSETDRPVYPVIDQTLINPRIVVHKSLRRLDLYSGDRLVRQYPIALGRQPAGAKSREGDGRTPEGEFYICVKHRHSRHGPALGISYPSPRDGRRGLEYGLIDDKTQERIERAHLNRRIPPWYTPLGGEVFIYGGGIEGDWTGGSIALRPDDAAELFNAVPEGTSITILP
ncbi:MAG: L,D-transpeptidase [Phycisphaeraceae bacterium]|nr:L,D-transpeptidase [Phycisphaeraceae bacterium]